MNGQKTTGRGCGLPIRCSGWAVQGSDDVSRRGGGGWGQTRPKGLMMDKGGSRVSKMGSTSSQNAGASSGAKEFHLPRPKHHLIFHVDTWF